MGYTIKNSCVRVDLLKSSGKWYTTCSVDMNNVYYELNIVQGLLNACQNAYINRHKSSGWDINSTPSDWLKQGGMIVCLEPYCKYPCPLVITSSTTLDDF